MKKNQSLLFKAAIFALALTFTACSSDDDDNTPQNTVVTFEDLTLGSESAWKGATKSVANSTYESYGATYNQYDSTFGSFGVSFSNSYTTYTSDYGDGSFWSGFAYSNSTSTGFTDYTTDCNSVTGGGHNSKTFAVGYSAGTITISASEAKTVLGCYLTNNTYAYNSMTNGDSYAKKFEAGDYFRVVFKGDNGNSVKFSLADMNNGGILTTWQWCDLSGLGKVKTITFSFESSDSGDYGINTPTYFCMDDLTISNQ